MMFQNPYLFQKMVLLAFKTMLSPSNIEDQNFYLNFEHCDLQTIRNECVRFGGQIDIEVSYKILWLEILNETPLLDTSLCFQ
jgi:hypothetical protein